MALKNDIKLGLSGFEALLDPGGRKFTEGIMEFARQDRTVNARGVKDIRASKKKFNLDYELADTATRDVLIAHYNQEAELSLIVTNQDGTTTTYAVLMAPFDWTRVKAAGDGLWSGLSIELQQV
jgi:hypothetical protein